MADILSHTGRWVMIFLLLSLFVCRLSSARSTCIFPESVQSLRGDLRRDWHGHIMRSVRDSPKQYSIIATYHDDVMRTTVLGGSLAKDKPKPYERRCLREVRYGRFLSTHQDIGSDQITYICIEFINHSADVIQLRISDTSTIRQASLCDDERLVLDDWPWVNWDNLYHSYQECPLSGGYQIKIFDKARREGVCDAYDRNTRLESECTSGEGMVFNFKEKSCIPKGLNMHQTQTVYCMGSWSDDTYTYSVLRHATREHLWCFRYPYKRDDAFVAQLFHDVQCHQERTPPTKEYLRIDMMRDIPRPLTSLCVDDYEACHFWKEPCKPKGSKQQMMCARRCEVCTDSRPSVCTLPHQFRGQWLENSGEDERRITIDDHQVTVEQYGSMNCVEWAPSRLSPDAKEAQQMLVHTFENGCEPRYSCAHLKKETPSILRYRLSKHLIWPFFNVDPNHIDCNAFHYIDGHVPNGVKFHSSHFKTLVSEAEHVYVDCHFRGPRKFEVVFEDGVVCKGMLTQEGLSVHNKLKMQLDTCPNPQAEQQFACLDSLHHHIMNDQIIVVESLNSSHSIRCFLFPAVDKDTFYLVSTEQCHENAALHLQNEWFRPLAHFTQQHPIPSNIRVVVLPKEHTDHNAQYSKVEDEAKRVNARGVTENNAVMATISFTALAIMLVFNIVTR